MIKKKKKKDWGFPYWHESTYPANAIQENKNVNSTKA
jgi:hypothetical protein